MRAGLDNNKPKYIVMEETKLDVIWVKAGRRLNTKKRTIRDKEILCESIREVGTKEQQGRKGESVKEVERVRHIENMVGGRIVKRISYRHRN